MPAAALGSLLRYLRRLHGRSADETTDAELLRRYVAGEEKAFAALVHRHAPMVWGVCRRLLDNEQDAEDAFQAAFLVLLKKAESLRAPQSLAAFLHGVASRIARKARVTAQRRQRHEARAEASMPSDPFAAVSQRELRALLDEELACLPEKYRTPLVLCYLEGMSYTEAARQLGWRDGTVCGRLARARELLRQRLSRRGLTLSGAALTAALTESASAPAATVAAAARMATLFALGQAAGSGAVSAPVAALAQGALHAMSAAKLKTAAALLAVSCLLAGGGGLAAHRLLTVKEETPQRIDTPAAEEPDRKEKTQENRRDLQGDPLPPNAIARLGTTRLRHGDNIFELFFTPDGKRLVSADRDGAHLWDAASGRKIRWLGRRFQTSLRSLSLPADGKTMVLAEHHSGTIQILDLADGKLLRQFKNGPDHDDRFCAAIFSPDGKLLASNAGKSIRLWNSETGKQIRQWRVDTGTIHRILFTPDGKTLISACDDRTIRFWDTSTGKEARRIADHPGPAIGLALSPDGKILASQGSTKRESNLPNGGRGIIWLADNKVHLWDAATGKKLRHLEALGPSPIVNQLAGFHPNTIYHFRFAPDGKTLVTAGADLTVRFWDVSSGKELRRWENHWVNSLAFSPDGKVLATGVEGSIRLWDAATGRELREQPGHHGGVRSLVLSPDGCRIASAGTDRTVRI
jgi:RNA polymerase sigma factor (sigma-70 family)